MTKLVVGAFFGVAGAGFAVDLLLLNHPPLGHGFFWPVFWGVMAAGIFVTRVKKLHLALPLWLAMMAFAALAYRTVHVSQLLPLPHAFYRRIVFDAVGIYSGMGLGFRLLLSFITSEGLDSVRIQTELSLAHDIQATLVPTISFQNGTVEIYGQSIPSAKMGGDLIDVIESDGNLLVDCRKVTITSVVSHK
jgi:hypothetical protein